MDNISVISAMSFLNMNRIRNTDFFRICYD